VAVGPTHRSRRAAQAVPAPEIIIKTAIAHTVTYFIAGIAAYTLFDYPFLLAETDLGASFRSLGDPMVIAGPALQPIRGLLFGCVFYMLREPFFGVEKGWLTMWVVLASIGILGTFGAPPGSIEGVIYTVLPMSLHLTMLPEVLAQSFLLSWLLFQWVTHPGSKWINWAMAAAFLLVLLFPVLALVVTPRG